MWIWLVLFYGLLKGARDIIKKLALQKNSVMEVLLVYTFLGFVMLVPEAGHVGTLTPKYYILVAIKSFVIFVAWTLSFISIKKLPVSLYGVLDLSRILFSTMLGVLIFGEHLDTMHIVALTLVCFGLFMLGRRKQSLTANDGSTIPIKFFIMALVSCLLNSVSAYFDKALTKEITSLQLQFWYMLFLVLFYLIYVIISRTHIRISSFTNPWVWLLAILFIAADRALFIANSMPESQMTVMTLIKQSGCLVMIVGGKIVFKEKDIMYKLFCASIIIIGIVLSVI